MPIPTLAKWQDDTSADFSARGNPLILDIDTLLDAYHSGTKTDIQKQKILILILYISTQWLATKSKRNWRRTYVKDLITDVEAELRSPALLQATKDRVGQAGLTLKEDPIELLQPKDLSGKYGLSGSTQFHRLSGHSAKGFVSGFGSKNDLRGRLKFLARIAPADYVDELKILAAANAARLDKMKTHLAYLCKAERQERQLSLGTDGLFHLDGDDSPYTSPADTPDLCVMDTHELIYVSSNKAAGKFHHSSFFSGKPVKFAGEMRLKQGTVNYINNLSGHYKPSTQDLLHAVRVLDKKYLCDLTAIKTVDDGAVHPPSIEKWRSAHEFLSRGGVPQAKAATAGQNV